MIKHPETIPSSQGLQVEGFKIKRTIDQAANILVITHQKPDGDGLGALSAVAYYLSTSGKKHQLFCLDPVPLQYSFLPFIHQVTSDPEVFKQQFDLLIVLDSGDLEYAGVAQVLAVYPYPYTLINIDHHATNRGYGQINLVLAGASSVSEIIYHLFRSWHLAISKEVATALLNGIIFDTGSFSNAATSLSALEAASHLLNLGARHKQINENFLRNKSLGLLKLWGRAFQRLTYNGRYDLAFTVVTQKDIEDCQVPAETVEGLANFLNELAGAKVVLVLREAAGGLIKGSFRTTTDDVDVGRLAQIWGGGGHQKAAGFSLKGKIVYNNHKWSVVD